MLTLGHNYLTKAFYSYKNIWRATKLEKLRQPPPPPPPHLAIARRYIANSLGYLPLVILSIPLLFTGKTRHLPTIYYH